MCSYLAAYAGFRFADLIVGENEEDCPAHEELSQRIAVQLPILVTFAAAPFERTYLYGGSAPAFVSALGLLIALWGMWLALGARVQLDFYFGKRPSIRCSSSAAFIVTSGIRSTRVHIW